MTKTAAQVAMEKTAPPDPALRDDKKKEKLPPGQAQTAEYNAGAHFPISSAEAKANQDAAIISTAPASGVPIFLREARIEQAELDERQAELDRKKAEALNILSNYHYMHRARVERGKDLSYAEEQLRGLENLAAVPAEEHAVKIFGSRFESQPGIGSTAGILAYYHPLATLPLALEAARKFVAKLREEMEAKNSQIAALQKEHNLPDPWKMKSLDELAHTGISDDSGLPDPEAI